MITNSTPTLTLNCNLGNEKPTEVRKLILLEATAIFRESNMQYSHKEQGGCRATITGEGSMKKK